MLEAEFGDSFQGILSNIQSVSHCLLTELSFCRVTCLPTGHSAVTCLLPGQGYRRVPVQHLQGTVPGGPGSIMQRKVSPSRRLAFRTFSRSSQFTKSWQVSISLFSSAPSPMSQLFLSLSGSIQPWSPSAILLERSTPAGDGSPTCGPSDVPGPPGLFQAPAQGWPGVWEPGPARPRVRLRACSAGLDALQRPRGPAPAAGPGSGGGALPHPFRPPERELLQ